MAAERSTQSRRPLFFRWLLYLLTTLVILLGFVLVLLYGLLYSEAGSRWALNKAQDWLPLSIEQSSGRIGDEITALNLEYEQGGMVIHIDQLNYRITDIHWWQRKLVFDYIRLGHVSIQLPDNESTTAQPLPPAAKIDLPVSVVLNELFVQEIQVNSEQQAYGPILASATVDDGEIDLANVQLLDAEIQLKVSGQVELHNRWPFDLTTQWAYTPERLQGAGSVSGDITALQLAQSMEFNNDYARGRSVIETDLTLQPELKFDAAINSERLLVPVANNEQINTVFKQVALSIKGQLDNYQFNLTANSEQTVKPLTASTDKDHYKEAQTHHNKIRLTAQGNTEQLDIETLKISGDFGAFTAHSTVNFSPQLKLSAEFNSDSFNPQWLLPDWPGHISGSGQLVAAQTAQTEWQLELKDLNLQGQLKEHELFIQANAQLHDEVLSLKPLSLDWGKNNIQLEGQLSIAEQTGTHRLKFDLNVPQPQLLMDDLTGHIQTSGQLSGSVKALSYNMSLTANNIVYQDNQVHALTVTGDGRWPDQLQLDMAAQEIYAADQAIPKLNISLKGNRQQHEIVSDVMHQDISTQLTLVGGWFDDKQQWRGQIEQHSIQLNDSDQGWQLREPADIVFGQELTISPACWFSKEGDGEACLELDAQTDTELALSGQLKLRNLHIELFNAFWPEDLRLEGLIQGSADLDYQQQNLSMTADLHAEQASIYYREGQKNAYQASIKTAQLTARQNKGLTEIKTRLELDDNSFLAATAELHDSDSSSWPEITTEIDGNIKNSRFLVALSPELEQLEGEFSLSGQVNGPLNQPAVNFSLQQQTGFLILRQTGSRLSNIKVNVDSTQAGLMAIQATADSRSGSVKLDGELNIQQLDDWSYQGSLTGENFRLLTLPELTVNIEPDLNIDASSKAINVTGRLTLPMAEVNIKNLPPSATTTSPDVVIHRPDDEQQQSKTAIPVHYDIKTEIVEPISIQLMGLQAKMAGQIRVYDEKQEPHGEGRLNLTEGFYKLYGQRLEIERGELIFNGPVDNPGIDVKATRESDDGSVTAGILITGTVNQLNTTLFSEPAMSQLAILSYLTTGRGLNESGGGTSGEQLAQAAILLGLKRGDSVFSQLQSTFGIDVLTIKQGANNEDSYIEAGQNIGDDLYVGYSQGLFNRLGFWILRYKINDALRLETTQGENQTVDLIYVRRKK